MEFCIEVVWKRAQVIEVTLTQLPYHSSRHGRSTVDQVTLLTQDIEDSFSAKKAETAFVYLSKMAPMAKFENAPFFII